MNRLAFTVKSILLGLTLLSLAVPVLRAEDASQVRSSDAKPNIILVMADDQGWGDVGYNGHPFVKTPEIDAMANDGFVFDRFYAAAPVCSPTRASVMTGRNPIRCKVTNHGRYMRPQEQTIAESLKAAGYVTGIFGKVHLGSGQPDSPCNPTGMGFDEWCIGLNYFDNDPYLSRNGKVEHREGKGSVLAMDDAIEFVSKHGVSNEGVSKKDASDQPFFMTVWFPSPHDPHQEVPDGPPLYTGKEHAGYYREITLLDQQLGRLRKHLRHLGIQDNTILWYCSDNGGLNRETSGGRERKGSVYEGGLRVPGIIEWPAADLHGRTGVPVWTCDIYPTLLSMAGVDSPLDVDGTQNLDGIDVSNIIAGKSSSRDQPMGFWHQFQPGQATHSDRILKAIMEKQQAGAPLPHNEHRMRKDVDEFPQFVQTKTTGHAAWNDWPWKLHRINGKKFELYNLVDDPMEQNDLSGDPVQHDRLVRMQTALVGWMRSVVRSINGVDYQDASKPVIVPTPVSLKFDPSTESCVIDESSRILVRPTEKQASLLPSHGKVLASELEILTGLRVPVVVGADKAEPNDIVLSCLSGDNEDQGNDADSERYTLAVGSDGILISADSFVGVTHGTSSLLQLIDADTLAVPSVSIEDHPAAPYRALMVDVARTPHSIGVIKDAVRLCRLYKVRYLQLHLTDDQHFTFPFSPVTDNLQRNHCYTLGELKNLVTYADARGVTIIPELDLPGHSSRLRASGYLSPGENDADVASPENYEKIGKIIDAMIDVFESSPYFHIGGDESGAGRKLVPFLAEVNKRVRARGRRLLVWEGFHGAPTDLIPATGDDRVIVMAWESSYNAPWDLLNNGYQIINASWKPTYLTGGYGGLIHAGSTGGKRFPLEDIYRWNKDTFMHWEPGRPVFEDRGPSDPNRDDGEWNAGWIGKDDQILGGQMLYWEQYECSVLHFLSPRLPILAERLWNPSAGLSFAEFQERIATVHERVLPVLQPIEILPVADDPSHPVVGLYQPYAGDEIKVTLRNRTKVNGVIRYSTGGWSGQLNSPNFQPVPKPDQIYDGPLTARGPFSVRAELVRDDSVPVDGHSWQFYNNWPNRVEVTEFDIGRRSLRKVPDLAALPESKRLRQYQMPYVRGLMQNVAVRGQMTRADLVAPASGTHTLELRTQSGHATLYFDQNQNGRFEDDEILVKDSPNDESGQKAEVTLTQGERYQIRIDHSTGMPRPVLSLSITVLGGKRTEISQFLQLPR
ncbi:Arylsulfatase A [Neorhodopirellula lusitana]|uniref:Arylsulfatase A n=1 Tax=Neorhodopirellula lusitana TaxID=445327 RepID=A0ABY1QN68_9BACT|nr:sulfatase-like hydrolase/transferase [Neorhodopirellula lusitana]SMP75418.1 Arylsulfatase A [Neorhodopirellula lusitana]